MALNRAKPPTRNSTSDYPKILETNGGRLTRTDKGVWHARLNGQQARGRTAREAAEKLIEKNT